MNITKLISHVFAAGILISACKKEKEENNNADPVTVITGIGNITEKVTVFKNQLGVLNTTTGVTGGRREINWDALPDSFALSDIPKDFFNPVGANAVLQRQRGFEYDAQGSFRSSKQGFAEIKPVAISDIEAFSGTKTFANVTAPAWPAAFKVAGQTTPAAISSIGVVFVGVDLANTTYIEPFEGSKSLGKFFAEPHNNESPFSFVAVTFNNPKITSVKVVHGNGLIESSDVDISNGGTKDLVVLDDIIYSEPVAHQ